MISFTFRTLPFTNTESQVIVDIPTDVTAFRRRKPSVNLNNMAAIPRAFILEHVDEGIPAAIADGLGKAMILNHVSDSKTLDVDRLVFAYKLNACLMEKVLPLVRDLFMLARKSFNCFPSISRSLLFLRCSTLKLFEFLFRCPEKLRRFNNFGVGRCNERLDSVVESNFTAGIDRFWNVQFAENGSVVFARRRLGNGDRLHDTFNRSVRDYLDSFTLGDVEFSFVKRPTLRNGKGLLVTLLLELGKRGAFIEEVIVCNIQIAKCLLKRLGVDIFKPFKFRFQLRQCSGIVAIGKPFAMLCIVINTLSQEIVIHKARAAKFFRKILSLLTIRIYSVFECLMYYHGYNYSMIILNCQY